MQSTSEESQASIISPYVGGIETEKELLNYMLKKYNAENYEDFLSALSYEQNIKKI